MKAISNSAEAVARILLGEPVPELPPLQASDIATELMYQVAKIQSKYWKSIDVQSCLPIDGKFAPAARETALLISRILAQKSRQTLMHTRLRLSQVCLLLLSRHVSAKWRQTDMIKVHRAHHLYNKYGMTCLPLALRELQTKFPEQVMNTYVAHLGNDSSFS